MSTLSTGAPLTKETFNDFVERLRHDCVGERVQDHCTADAFFVVQNKIRVYGLDKGYSDKRVIYDSGNNCDYETPLEYWNDCEDEEQHSLNMLAAERGECTFLELEENDQWGIFEDGEVEDHSVIYYEEKWEALNFHFTHAAAEAFIERKGHDYGDLRVYANAHTYGWEYNAIKHALLDGRLQFVPTIADDAPVCNRITQLEKALEVVKAVLESDDPAIADTIWVPGSNAETLLDHVYSALGKHCAREENN